MSVDPMTEFSYILLALDITLIAIGLLVAKL